MRLKDKVTIVTGAASGFGEGIARLYAAEGAKVAVADINAAGAKSVAASIGANAIAVTCDVTKRADIDALVKATRDAFGGRIDVVVNNAGWTHRNRPLLEVDEATFDKVYDINVKSIFHMVHAIVPLMRQQKGGVILNVGSVAGIRPRPGLTWYNSSKGAVNLMSKSLAVELGPDNIRVNRAARGVHGDARHAGEPQEVPGDDPARPHVHADRRGPRRALPRERRRGVHHGRRVSSGRRPHHLTARRAASPLRTGRRRASPRRLPGGPGRG
jgi:3-oxoacyl-[acyl-carrier protein] reductase